MNKFYRNKDSSYFIQEDYLSESDWLQKNELQTDVLSARNLEAAESTYDALLREARRDRLRLHYDNKANSLSIEERHWIRLDRVLCPEAYIMNEEEDCERSGSTLAVSTLLNSKLEGMNSLSSSAKQSENYMAVSSFREGDRFDALRDAYANGEDIIETSAWKHPFTKEELLHLRGAVLTEDANEDTRRAHMLMNKYYVSEMETALGNQRLELMKKVLGEIGRALQNNLDSTLPSPVNNSISAKETANAVDIIERKVGRRVYGSWEQVHPASMGVASQRKFFDRPSFSASRDHPAMYCASKSSQSINVDALSTIPLFSGTTLDDLGMSLLLADAHHDDSLMNQDPDSSCFIVECLGELATREKASVQGKVVLVAQKDQKRVFDVAEATLQARQSRSHRFEVPDNDNIRVFYEPYCGSTKVYSMTRRLW